MMALTTGDWVALLLVAPTCLAILGYGIWVVRPQRRLQRLIDQPCPAPSGGWPTLSVVITACDEAKTIEPALRSLLKADYPTLELIAVDDRSTDGTGALLDVLAAEDPRLQVIHIETLPSGWLGKVHALDQGIRRATGDFVLFCDADVHFAPGALRHAIAVAESRGRDHLAVLPELLAGDTPMRAALLGFGAAFFATLRADRVEEQSAEAYIGVGAFNLVRRRAYEQSAGFPWLKMEVADDVGLGMALKRSGARCSLYLGAGLLTLTWYENVRAMVHGLEKNLFGTVSRYRLWRLLLQLPFLFAVVLAPFVACVYQLWPLQLLGVLALAASYRYYYEIGRIAHYPRYTVLLGQFGNLIVIYALLRSAYLTLRRKGIIWRGTFYSIDELKREQRVKL